MFSKFSKFLSEIPFKLKGKKKFVSCDWLEHGIIFDHANIIRVCCEQSHEGRGRYILDDSFNGIWFDVEKIKEAKKTLKTQVRNGEIPSACKGCSFLRNDYWDDNYYFSNVLLTHWVNCNTKCVYCPAVRDKSLSDEKHYNIVPILEQLFDSKLIDESTKFSIAGGESTIYPEFDKMLYFLLDNGIENININTSGVKYSASIAEALSKGKVEVVISLDAGNEWLHKRIKDTSTFNVVTNNIKRYVEASPINENRVVVKFIILKGLNDNNKEILDWFLLCKQLGVKKLALDVDIAWYNEIQKNIPDYLKDLILFAKNMSKVNSVQLDLYDRADIIYKTIKIDPKVQ